MQDVFAPTSSSADALVSPLHTITYVTASGDAVVTMLSDGFGLEQSAWISSDADRAGASYLGLPDSGSWRACLCTRTDAAANVAVRVIEVDSSEPVIRPETSGRHIGGLSIGFPMHDIDAREAKLAALGVPSSVGRKDLDFQSPTGETYTSSEIHFIGPEDVYLLGVKRPDGLTPVGPMPAGAPIGAPAYSARCVTNADPVNRFFVEQLGFECRRDMALTVGSPSGLKLEAGSVERFLQLFAPGSGTGYLVLLDHGDIGVPSPAPTLGPPSRGVAMWTFATHQYEVVRRRVTMTGCRITAELSDHASPLLASKRSFIVEDPDKFPVEIVEL
ncbi:MAG: hypothetical protein AAGH76_05090 [Pseudomonadota bacterium]